MIKERPWLGWGFSGFRDYYVAGTIPNYDVLFHPHNIFLFLATGAGIPVMIGFCIVVGKIVYRAIKGVRRAGCQQESFPARESFAV